MNSIDQLKDIHLPQAVSLWPLAPGWYILFVMLILVLVISIGWRQRYRRKKKIPKALYHELRLLKKISVSSYVIADLSALLKRAALAFYPRERVAALQGEAWLQFLDETGRTQAFTQGAGRLLITAAYQPEHPLDTHELIDAIENWIKCHV